MQKYSLMRFLQSIMSDSHTFDALIEKARNNPALLQEIQDLL